MTTLEELKLRIGNLNSRFSETELDGFIESAKTAIGVDEVDSTNRGIIIDISHLFLIRAVLGDFDRYYSFRHSDTSLDRTETYRNLLNFYRSLSAEIRQKYPAKLRNIQMGSEDL